MGSLLTLHQTYPSDTQKQRGADSAGPCRAGVSVGDDAVEEMQQSGDFQEAELRGRHAEEDEPSTVSSGPLLSRNDRADPAGVHEREPGAVKDDVLARVSEEATAHVD